MKIVIAGGGIVGLTLSQLLQLRGISSTVIERMPAKAYVRRGYMLGFQGYDPLQEIGVLDEMRREGWDIAPREDGTAVAIAVEVGKLIHALQRDLDVQFEHSIVGLVKDGEGRVVGVEVEGPDGVRQIDADLVVACDGVGSRVRQMAGLEAEFAPLADATLNWMSPDPGGVSFAMAYLSDGGHIGTLGWPEGSAGWRSIEKVGEEAALAPGLDAIKEMWVRLLPECEQGIQGVTSMEQIRYGEPQLLTCPRWWTPGVILIGDSAHFFGPETGISSGIGMGDAQALAQAIMQNPEDPDAACQSYETWRAPVVRPYEAMDPGRQRMVTAGAPASPEDRWPPAE
jgi:2-polyprenyl-6-methoxyphenol hydroxylase-like FAD-dependent oxidoreductase